MKEGGAVKKLIALVAVALIAIAASQLVSTVGATGKATIARRVAVLEGKVRSLQRQVNVLKANDACETTVSPVSHYGNPAASQGYLYTPDGVNVIVTGGLDLTHAGEQPGGYVPLVNSSCISRPGAHFKPARIGNRVVGPGLGRHAK
jgi:hypothetical protein